ncbi:hypothetical protein BDD12DRAFT_50936 [Trichophaea hybrida]|nr:hypothetical protein BDD12DRAFT_50936 [Trichophaea hybrida]
MTPVATPRTTYYPSSPTPSIASVSSATSSVWSIQSTTSSNATSVASSTIDNFSTPSTAIIPSLSSQSILGPEFLRRATAPTPRGSLDKYGVRHPHPSLESQQPLPIERRQHPRRTNRLVESTTTQQCPAVEGCILPPVPSLQRQADRKVNFVENLVDSAAQIVETIWQPPKYMATQTGSKDAVLPLRTFIQETLRRSRTSYSTLQVALYYLIVIRPHLPGLEFDCSQLEQQEIQLVRAKQCGRRMFLAALILASKYLQDRNYSARAWSKISGLNTQEINVNEMAFLKAVDWKLHISEVVFQKWTDLVLKYTSSPSPSPVSPTRSSLWNDEEERKKEWCDLVLRLSPDLSEVELPCSEVAHPQIEFGPPLESIAAPKHTSPAPPALRKTNSMPAPASLPPRTLAPQFQNTNAFTALHQTLPNTAVTLPLPPPLQRPSPSLRGLHSISSISSPAVSSDARYRMNAASMTTPKVGGAMASVARNAMSSALSGCSQEMYSGTGAVRRGSEASIAGAQASRRSSLATCVSTINDESVSGSTSRGPPPPSAFKRQNSSEMHRLAVKGSTHSGIPVVLSIPSPSAIQKTPFMGSPARPTLLDNNRLVMASPKSTEAAWTLNMLREAPSPATTVGSLTPTSSVGRKRSCPSVYSDGNLSSGVTPKFRVMSGFSSPSSRCVSGSPVSVLLGSPSMGERGGKRIRCGLGMDGFDGHVGVAQGVR